MRRAPALVDADNSLGHVAGIYAMNMAIEKADTTGFASVAVRNSNHYGAAACFAMMALPKGMIGFSTTKTGRGECRTARRDVRTARQSSRWLRNTDQNRAADCVGHGGWTDCVGPCRDIRDGG